MHHLFLEFLSTKQFMLKEDDIIETHRMAGLWYANHGHNIDAIMHFKESKQYDELLKVVSIYYTPCSMEAAQFILATLDEIPQRLYEENLIIPVIYVRFLFNSYRMDEAANKLSEIRGKYEVMPLTKENKTILGEAYVMLALINLIQCLDTGEYTCEQFFKMADEYLPDGSSFTNSNNHLNPGVYACPVSRIWKGGFQGFLDIMTEVMPCASRVMNGCGHSTEYLMKTEVAFFQRDLKNAEEYAYQAIEKSQEYDQVDVETLAIFYLIRINISLGNYAKIWTLLEQSGVAAEKYRRYDGYSIFDITEGRLFVLQHQ